MGLRGYTKVWNSVENFSMWSNQCHQRKEKQAGQVWGSVKGKLFLSIFLLTDSFQEWKYVMLVKIGLKWEIKTLVSLPYYSAM